MSSDCLDEQALLDFLAGALNRQARVAALAHLDGCADCREVVASLANARRAAAGGWAAQPPTEPVPPLFAPEQGVSFGRYRLERKLGEGGMAEVFLATQLGPGGFERSCVVKRPLPSLARDGELRELFVAEAKVLAALEHPNIGRVLDVGEVKGRVYLALELVEGRDLKELISTYRTAGALVPLEAALEVIRQAALGLGAAHTAADARGEPLQLIHRDVSPHNLMLARSGAVKVIDFGLARSTLGEKTSAGVVKGKPRYYSPEQARGAPLDARTDVFSLGLVLHELLTSERAYDDEDPAVLLRRAVHGEVPRSNPAPHQIAQAAWELYLRCTRFEPGERPRSMAALVSQLDEVTDELGLGDGPAAVAALAARSPKALTQGERTQPLPRGGAVTRRHRR